MNSRFAKKQAALIGIAMSLVLLEQVQVYSRLQPLLEQALKPARIASMNVVQWFQTPLEAIFTSVDKAQRIKDLQERYALALVQLAQLDAVKEENAQLRELLDQPVNTTQQQFLARPILSLSYPAVEGGAANSIAVGSIITRNTVLIGRVSEVREHQSRVVLLMEKDARPILARTGEVQGIVLGDGRRVLLTEIPKDAAITQGDRVLSVGQEGVPSQLLIGTISSIENRPEAPTQTAILEQPVSFFDAALVEVW